MPPAPLITISERQLVAAHRQTVARIQGELDGVLRKIGDAQSAGEPINVAWLSQKAQLKTLLGTIETEMNGYSRTASSIAEQLQVQSIHLGVHDVQNELRTIFAHAPVGVNPSLFGQPNMDAIHYLLGRASNNEPLAKLFAGFGLESAQGARAALISGVALGDNPRAIGRRIAQALDVPRWRGQLIARQEAMRAYRNAQSLTLQANSDVVNSWVWVAALGSACICCTEMHGTVHPLDEDMVSHVACRCTMAPVTKGWDELLGNAPLETDTSDLLETSASVPSGGDWFEQQDAALQRDILGPAKFEAWQSGDLQLTDLIGHQSDAEWGPSMYEKSLKELGLDAQQYLAQSVVEVRLPDGTVTYQYRNPGRADVLKYAPGNNSKRAAGLQELDDALGDLRGS